MGSGAAPVVDSAAAPVVDSAAAKEADAAVPGAVAEVPSSESSAPLARPVVRNPRLRASVSDIGSDSQSLP